MPEIKGSVGVSGKNSQDDVALIQAMLVLAKNAKGKPYLNSYDGICGKNTKNAIIAFQQDNVFKHQSGSMDAGAGLKAAVPDATSGVININDVTFKQLASMLPADYKDLQVLPGGKIVYVSNSEQDVKNSCEDVSGEFQLQMIFRGKVVGLVQEVYKRYKIALWVMPPWAAGRRRDFAKQFALSPAVTNAGPGESNHNYGQAVDIGFKGLRWLKSDGSPVKDETHWLHKLDPKQSKPPPPEALRCWDAMRSTAEGLGLFRGPLDDRPHVQAWSDNLVNMPKRLAAHLTAVGTMKWALGTAMIGKSHVYQTDFGLGGKFSNVGTSKQIWGLKASVDKNMLASARTDALKKAAMQAGPMSPAWKNFKPLTAADIKAEDVTAMQKALKAEFEQADARWKDWTPY